MDGWRYVFGFRPIRSLILLLGFICLVGMPYAVLMPVFATRVLGGGPNTLGILMTAVGFGNAKAVTVVGTTRSGNEKTVRVSGADLKKHIVHRARKGCLLPGKLRPQGVKP